MSRDQLKDTKKSLATFGGHQIPSIQKWCYDYIIQKMHNKHV
jgi:hypothetical protein